MTIASTGARHRLMFSREENEGGGGGNGQQQQQQQTGEEWKPPASQDELNRIIQDRVSRVEKKYKDYDSLKEKATQYDALANESETEKERAIRQAREEALNEAMSKAVPKAVRAEFRAAAKGVLTKEQLDSLLEDLDLTKYATEDGDPDEEKIGKKISAFAPLDDGKGRNGNGRPPGFGQGPRETSTPKKGETGEAEAKRRFGDKAGTGFSFQK